MGLTKAQKDMLKKEVSNLEKAEKSLQKHAILASIIFGIIGLVEMVMLNWIIGLLTIIGVLLVIWIIIYPILSCSFQVQKRNREFNIKGK